MCINKTEITRYENLNKYANKNGVVVLGSTFMHDIPMAELRQSFNIHSDIYNRSLTDLRICEAKDVVKNIMETMVPKRILLQLGEVELGEKGNDVAGLISQLKEIVNMIKAENKQCKIVLVSVSNVLDEALKDSYNKGLENLACETKCQFADITAGGMKSESQQINTFMKLKYFMSDEMAAFAI